MKFKNEEDKELLFTLHPILLKILFDLEEFAQTNHKTELVITATATTKQQDKYAGRISNAHNTRRAVDIRTKNLPASIVNSLVDYVNLKEEYTKYHYVSSRHGKRRLAYYHGVGDNAHIHLAIHSRYSLTPLFKN